MKFSDPKVRPTVQDPIFENIPEDLRRLVQWVLWGFVWNKHTKQWAKVPFDAKTLGPAKSNNSSTWAAFDTVKAIFFEGKGGFDGIGFVFSVGDPYFGADFDNCIRDEKIDPAVTEWIKQFDSYTEKSVSGTGLHVIGKGVVGDGTKRGDFELYDRGRYFTFSGSVGRRRQIENRQEALEAFKLFLKPEATPQRAPREYCTLGSPTVQTVLERAFNAENGASLRALYEGGLNGHKSHSEAIASLCWKFAFWCDRNPTLLDSVIRGSRLYDSKWNSPRGKSTWGAREVDKAIAKCTEVFDWNKTSSVHLTQKTGTESLPDLSRFKFTNLIDLLAEPQEKIGYLWDRTLPCGGFSIVAAKPKVGKSTFARVFAVAVTQGALFFGRATKKGKVIYLCLEEKRAEVAEHFRRMGASTSDILIFTGRTPKDALAALLAAIDEHSPVLVIIDPLSRFVRVLDFNSYAEMTRQLEPLIDAARLSTCQVHVMALHHNGKGGDLREGGDALLGSTGLAAAVDCLVTLRNRDKVRTLESLQRYGENIPETIVHLDPITGIVSDAGDLKTFTLNERKKAILDALGSEPLTDPAIRELIGGTNAGLTTKALRALYDEGVLERSGGGKKGDPFFYRLNGSQEKGEPHYVMDELYIPPGATDAEVEALCGG